MTRPTLTRLRAIDRRHLTPGAAAFGAAILVALLGLRATADPRQERPQPPRPGDPVRLRLLGVNDFHGHLEPPVPRMGGAAWLGAHLDRAELPGRTIRVHAGDMVGASPLISSHFHDEPAIEAMNRMAFDVGTVGNHEFDEGGEEMLRLLRGGRRQGSAALKRAADGRLMNTSDPHFGGARFPYVAANTLGPDGRLVLPPYSILERAGVRLGFIGVTTDTTPDFLLPAQTGRWRWTDISEAVNRWVPELRRRGVEGIVVLAHSGAYHATGDSQAAVGEIVEEAREMSDAVDVVVAGHTHSQLNDRVDGKLVVEAFSYGTAYDKVDLRVDPRDGDVVASSAEIPRTHHHEVEPDHELARVVHGYARRIAPLGDRVVGVAAGAITRRDGELGPLAADAQRAFAKTDLAFANSGSMRADIKPGPVTYSDLFRVHAYEHAVMRMEMRGREVSPLLDQLGKDDSQTGLSASGLRGRRLKPDAIYTVAANELIATGDHFPALRDHGRRKRVVGTDLEALTAWIERLPRPFGD